MVSDYATIPIRVSERMLRTNIYADVDKHEIPADLRKKIAEQIDELIMHVALGGRGYEPSTLYVDKYGHYSTVNPEEQQRQRRNRHAFGLIVSS